MIFGQLLSLVLGFSLLAAFGITTDQIMQNVYDSTNTALRTNLVAGGGSGSVGPGTVNNIAKFTPSTTTIGNSGITDNGSGAIGYYPASATPQAVTETYASGTGTDIAGAATTIKLSGSTGSGVGGTLSIQNTNKAGTGTTANTYGNVLTLSPPNTGTTAPVNYLDIKNAIASSGPTISAVGSDSAIPITITPKGTGQLFLPGGSLSGPPGVSIGGAQTGLSGDGASNLELWLGNNLELDIGSNLVRLRRDALFGWSSATNNVAAIDTQLSRDGAANVIQMGADAASPSAQTFKGADTSTNGNAGGALTLAAGNGLTTGAGGALTAKGGTSGTGGTGGAATLGGAPSAGTDIAGGNTTVAAGPSTGAGIGGDIIFQTTPPSGTGTTVNTLGSRERILGKYTTLTESSATSFARIGIPQSSVAGGNCVVSVQANDASDFQARTLRFGWSAVNKAGTITAGIDTPDEAVAVSTGTLTCTITAVDAGSDNLDLQANCVSSLTQTVLQANAIVTKNFGTGTITAQ